MQKWLALGQAESFGKARPVQVQEAVIAVLALIASDAAEERAHRGQVGVVGEAWIVRILDGDRHGLDPTLARCPRPASP